MDLRKLKTILDLFQHSTIQELELTEGEEKIRLVKDKAGTTTSMVQASNVPAQIIQAPPSVPAITTPNTKEEKIEDSADDNIVKLTSPMVGTFYSRPNPDEANFVSVGDHVTEGDTVCVIEAMKLFNNVSAPVTGTVNSIEVKNEEAVGFGDLLLTFKAD